MPSNVSLSRISIEAFRGFRNRQDIDLDASAVIVAGPNGTGKTSFFDALQWVLVGKIERLEEFRAKKNVEHIVNQYRAGDRATVELELTIRESSLRIRRVGDHSSSVLELSQAGQAPVFGREAEDLLQSLLVPMDGVSLEMSLSTSGLLQQDVMRAVLQAKPSERYRHLSTVLGLAELEDFEQAIKAASKASADNAAKARGERDDAARSLETATARAAQAREQQLLRPSVEAALSELRALADSAPDLLRLSELDLFTAAPNLPAFSAALAELARRVDHLRGVSREYFDLERALVPEPDPDTLEDAANALRDASASVTSTTSTVEIASAELAAAESASAAMARLAAAALPLLDEHCPVCGQSIDPEHVESELRRLASGSDELVARSDAVQLAQGLLEAAMARRNDAASRLASLQATASEWSVFRSVAARRADALKVATASDQPLAISLLVGSDSDEALRGAGEFINVLRAKVAETLDFVTRGQQAGSVARAEAEEQTARDSLESRESRWAQLATKASGLKALADAAVRARVDVTERRFRAIQPLVADIYGRLDPHPSFKAIEFELDTYYRKGTTTPLVRDVLENVAADPLVIFSTSQANIAALSYFLAMGWSAGARSLPFVLLDDPLQSMDDVNVLGFADLCRFLRANRQLAISTHERRFASLLERKLAPRTEETRTIVLDFVGWDRSGPTIVPRDVPPQMLQDPIRVVQAAD